MQRITAIAAGSRRITAVAGLFALLIVSVPVNFYFLFGDHKPSVDLPRSASAIFGGDATAAVTESYNQGFLLRDAGIDLYGTLSWLLFREGRKGVLAGKDDWLFSAEEFETGPHSAANIAHAVTFIGAVRDRLAKAGSGLVVALIPAKASIYPEELGRYALPDEPRGRYDRLMGMFAEAKIGAPDLRVPLVSGKAKGQVYLRTDTHWTSFGATVAARTLAGYVAARDLGPAKYFTEKDLPVAEHSGDLMRFVRVADVAGASAPKPDELTTFEAIAADDASLLGDDTIPVVLVGTSYSANPKWSFEPALKMALSRDVLNVAAEGVGPFRPMSDYLRSAGFRDSPPKLVIWEIPERFVDDDYPATDFRLE